MVNQNTTQAFTDSSKGKPLTSRFQCCCFTDREAEAQRGKWPVYDLILPQSNLTSSRSEAFVLCLRSVRAVAVHYFSLDWNSIKPMSISTSADRRLGRVGVEGGKQEHQKLNSSLCSELVWLWQQPRHLLYWEDVGFLICFPCGLILKRWLSIGSNQLSCTTLWRITTKSRLQSP